VKDRRGAIGRATGIAEGMAATMRRIQREREPRVMIYDVEGEPTVLQPHSRGYERVLEAAELMVEAVGRERERERERRRQASADSPVEEAE
jgi:hypothetical protein